MKKKSLTINTHNNYLLPKNNHLITQSQILIPKTPNLISIQPYIHLIKQSQKLIPKTLNLICIQPFNLFNSKLHHEQSKISKLQKLKEIKQLIKQCNPYLRNHLKYLLFKYEKINKNIQKTLKITHTYDTYRKQKLSNQQYFSYFKNQIQKSIHIQNSILQQHKIQIIQQNQFTKYFISDHLPKIALKNINNTADILIYQVFINLFKIQVSLLIIGQCSAKYYSIESGAYGQIQVQNYNNKQLAFKRIKFNHPNEYLTNKLAIKANKIELQLIILQYSICKIASAYRIGPKIFKYINAQLICFDDCVQFMMQRCKNIELENINIQNFQKQIKSCVFLLHQFHIIHKDLKPANMMYSPAYDSYVLIDFGISNIIYESIGQKTETYYEGTQYFMGQQLRKLKNTFKGYVDLYINDIEALQISFKDIKKTMQKNEKKKRNDKIQNELSKRNSIQRYNQIIDLINNGKLYEDKSQCQRDLRESLNYLIIYGYNQKSLNLIKNYPQNKICTQLSQQIAKQIKDINSPNIYSRNQKDYISGNFNRIKIGIKNKIQSTKNFQEIFDYSCQLFGFSQTLKQKQDIIYQLQKQILNSNQQLQIKLMKYLIKIHNLHRGQNRQLKDQNYDISDMVSFIQQLISLFYEYLQKSRKQNGYLKKLIIYGQYISHLLISGSMLHRLNSRISIQFNFRYLKQVSILFGFKNNPYQARICIRLGKLHRKLKDYNKGVYYIESAYSILNNNIGNNRLNLSECEYEMLIMYQRLKQQQKAKKNGWKCLKFYEDQKNNEKLFEIYIAMYLLYNKNKKQSDRFFNKLIQIKNTITYQSDINMINACQIIVKMFLSRKMYSQAIETIQKTKKLIQNSYIYQKNILYNQIVQQNLILAQLYIQTIQFQLSKDILIQNMILIQKIKNPSYMLQFKTKYMQAVRCFKIQQYQNALDYGLEAQKLLDIHKNNQELSVRLLMIKLYVIFQNFNNAKRQIKICEQFYKNGKQVKIEVLKLKIIKIQIYLADTFYDMALKEISTAFNIIYELKLQQTKYFIQIKLLQTKVYSSIQKYKQALHSIQSIKNLITSYQLDHYYHLEFNFQLIYIYNNIHRFQQSIQLFKNITKNIPNFQKYNSGKAMLYQILKLYTAQNKFKKSLKIGKKLENILSQKKEQRRSFRQNWMLIGVYEKLSKIYKMNKKNKYDIYGDLKKILSKKMGMEDQQMKQRKRQRPLYCKLYQMKRKLRKFSILQLSSQKIIYKNIISSCQQKRHKIFLSKYAKLLKL